MMSAVRDSPLAIMEEAVQAVLGPLSLSKCTLCLNCKGWCHHFVSLFGHVSLQ